VTGLMKLCYRSAVDSAFRHAIARDPARILQTAEQAGCIYLAEIILLLQILDTETEDLIRRLSLPNLLYNWGDVPPTLSQRYHFASADAE